MRPTFDPEATAPRMAWLPRLPNDLQPAGSGTAHPLTPVPESSIERGRATEPFPHGEVFQQGLAVTTDSIDGVRTELKTERCARRLQRHLNRRSRFLRAPPWVPCIV